LNIEGSGARSGAGAGPIPSTSTPIDPDPDPEGPKTHGSCSGSRSATLPKRFRYLKRQGFGSGSGFVLDPYSIGPVDPDPYSESGSGSRRAKMTHKSRKNLCFEVLDGLFCELEASSVTWTYLKGQ